MLLDPLLNPPLGPRVSWKSAVLLSSAVLLLPTTASAAPQDLPAETPSTTPLGFPAIEAPEPQNASTIPVNSAQSPYLFNLQNKPVTAIGSALQKAGLYLNGFDFSEFQGVPSGGFDGGSYGGSWTQLGLDADMKKIAGIDGAKIHFSVTAISGRGRWWQHTGSVLSVTSTFGNHNGLQLREFAWDQAILSDKLHILVGRFNKGGEFDSSELYCQFSTIICASPVTFMGNNGGPPYVTSSWAARVLFKPTTHTYIKAAIYANEPILTRAGHGGWPGKDWSFSRADGALLPVEIGYKTSFADDLYPRAYTIGATFDTSRYNDPIRNVAGENLVIYGGTPLQHTKQSSVYLQAQQMVWKPDPRGTRGLTLFGAANVTTKGNPPISAGIVLGALDYGPFKARPNDTAGIVFQTLWIDRSTRRVANDIVRLQGIDHKFSRKEYMVEVNYGAAVAPGLKIQPYLEYIWHPDQIYFPNPRPGVTHALQIGVMLDFELNEAFGLPRLRRTNF